MDGRIGIIVEMAKPIKYCTEAQKIIYSTLG
jgi:hypothetical protein